MKDLTHQQLDMITDLFGNTGRPFFMGTLHDHEDKRIKYHFAVSGSNRDIANMVLQMLRESPEVERLVTFGLGLKDE